MAGALIITAELSAADQAWLDRLRSAHYPVDRNQLPAHLTMLYALPPSSEAEARARLSRLASARAPAATIDGIMDLGGGVAFRVASDDLDRIRDELASDFHGLLERTGRTRLAPARYNSKQGVFEGCTRFGPGAARGVSADAAGNSRAWAAPLCRRSVAGASDLSVQGSMSRLN